ncbi:hypothetical protein [Nocardioides sp.]|uniref:hypothetical protein n=1 Tax=Nocardioides sp. TaxID=35761 RepID=UPI0035656311
MRFQRTLALVGVALVWLALGPWVLLAVAALLLVPRVRYWLWPTREVVAGWAGAVVAATVLVVAVPDGWLPVPTGSGALVTDSYVGRPTFRQPLRLEMPAHPGLAADGAGTSYDAWSSGASPGGGPVGESPRVATGWFGWESCAELHVDRHDRLVAVCGRGSGPRVRVLDSDSLRPLATKVLPEADVPSEDRCGRASYLDDDDRVVLATADRRVFVVDTDDAEGKPDLTTVAVHDLGDVVPGEDCVVDLVPDWSGRIWFATLLGRVGVVPYGGGVARALHLDEPIEHAISVDAEGGVYVATVEAMTRVTAPRDGSPTVTWRAPYDRPTTPTLLPDDLLATTDQAGDRLDVVVLRRADGEPVCRRAVTADGEGSTSVSLVSVGSGVVVTNTHGAGGPLGTRLGMTGDGGLTRVDVAGGDCAIRWRSDQVVPGTTPALSQRTGLLYASTKPHSWWGVNAWYLTAIDARTGRRVFSVRTGRSNRHATTPGGLSLGPGDAAYLATRSGLVRVQDKQVAGQG